MSPPPRKIFVSYSHAQRDWAHDRLWPCLQASGAEVLIDQSRFLAGQQVLGQMDALQDQADASLLVLSPEYVASPACLHEMRRAVAKDPHFTGGTIPIVRAACTLPSELTPTNQLQAPLRVDFKDDLRPDPWKQLFQACQSDLRSDAPHWLETRDEVRRMLQRGESVNLVVHGQAGWRELVKHLAETVAMREVDVALPGAITRPGLLAQMLGRDTLPSKPKGQDLVEFQRQLEAAPAAVTVALFHAERMEERKYGTDLFFTLRHLVSEARKLNLLIVSRSRTFVTLVPAEVRASLPTFPVVELKGRP